MQQHLASVTFPSAWTQWIDWTCINQTLLPELYSHDVVTNHATRANYLVTG